MNLKKELEYYGNLIDLIDQKAGISSILDERLQEALNYLGKILSQKANVDDIQTVDEEKWLKVFAALPLRNLLIVLEKFETASPGSNAKFLNAAKELQDNDIVYHNFAKRLIVYSRLKSILETFDINRMQKILLILNKLNINNNG